MDAPPIRYAKTSDGVNIAFSTLGEGPPLLLQPAFSPHLLADWEVDIRRNAYLRLAERATIIRYDPRGIGLSPSDSLDISPETSVRDVEAVVDHLGLKRFAMCGPGFGLGVTFPYPASHPERVSHLVITLSPLRRGALRSIAALRSFSDFDWESFTEVYARLFLGWDDPGSAQVAALVKASHTSTSFWAFSDAITKFSPEPWLPHLNMPVLILYGLGSNRTVRYAQELASGIPGAAMLGLPGWPYGIGVNETVVSAILDFINTAPAAPGAPIPPPKIDISAVRTIVWTDLVAHTQMMQRLGDEAGRVVLREHERITREALGTHGGSEVKAMGDGFMAWFPSATRAVECAVTLQKAFDARNASETEPIHVRIGINAGEPIAEGDDLFGASVIATARIAAQATGGQILASDVVRQLLAGKGFAFTDQGEHPLKGFDEPARLYEVRWQEDT